MQTLKPDDTILNSLTALLKDAGNQFSFYHCKDQQLTTKYLLNRYLEEGIGFVTKSLPKFGKHFDTCLKNGTYTPYLGYKTPRRGIFPLFLKGLIQYVFADNGTLLDEPDIEIIRFIRQLSYMFYKVEGDYPEELINGSVVDFITTDSGLSRFVDCSPNNMGAIHAAQLVIKEIFQDMEWDDMIPKPGPGQNSTNVSPCDRYEPKVKYLKVHAQFPYYRYFYCGGRDHLLARVQNYRALPEQRESVSRLACVPKDSRGPRLICMEPPEFMWLQQGLSKKMVRQLERHPMTKGQVNFTDQSINGDLALVSSVTQDWATLDMKEASDRISRDLVSVLFDEVPRLRDAILSLTTDWILTPSHGAFRKRKFASMGSALCFPVMSVVHYALGIGVIHANTNRSPKALAKSLFVYGDDLIVDNRYTSYLLEEFPIYDLKFNQDKCCFNGNFRESCGVDAFKGNVITPIRVKKLGVSKANGVSIRSALDMFHAFFNRGYWCTAKVFQDVINASVKNLPCVSKHSQALGWIVPKDQLIKANGIHTFGYNEFYQTFTKRVRVLTNRPSSKPIGDWELLVRALVHAQQGKVNRFTERSNVTMRWKRLTLSGL